jgi:hypothetical protein
MKKAIGPRKSLFVCMLQLQEAIESGGEGGCRGGCVTVYRLCVREELVVCSWYNNIGLLILSTPKNVK